MKILDIHIDGFGIFNDLKLSGLSPHINLIFGDNEAGKSTLTAFVQQVLFGFPTKREASRKQYLPLRGGNYGGRLTVTLETGERCVIVREEGPYGGNVSVTGADGVPGGSHRLESLTGTATGDLYEAIFAFGLDELSSLHNLENENIAKFIYSAGLGINPEKLRKLYRYIEKRQSELYKKGGQKASINVLLKQLESDRSEISNAAGDIHLYDESHAALSEKLNARRSLDESIGSKTVRLKEAELFFRIYDDWKMYNDVSSDIADLPQIPELPPDIKDRYNSLRNRAEHEKEEIVKLENSLETYRTRLESFNINEKLLEESAQIEALVERRESYISAKSDHAELSVTARNERTEFERRLFDLGEDWSTDRLMNIDISLPVRSELETFKDKFKSFSQELGRRENDAAQQRRVISDHEAREESARVKFNELPEFEYESLSEIEEVRERLFRLSDSLERRAGIDTRIEHQHDRIKDKNGELERLHMRAASGTNRTGIIASAGALLSFAASAALYFTGGDIITVYALAAFGLLMVVTAVAGFLNNRKTSAQAFDEHQRQAAVIRDEIGGINAEIGALEQEKLSNNLSINELSEGTGVTGPVDLKSVREKIRKVELEKEHHRTKHELTSSLNGVREDLERARNSAEISEKEKAETERKLHSLENDWKLWLQEKRFPEGLDTAGLERVFIEIEKLRAVYTQIREREVRIDSMWNAVQDFENRLEKIIINTETPVSENMPPEDTASTLRNELESARTGTADVHNLCNQISDAERDLDQRNRLFNDIHDDIQQIFSAAGAESEHEFIQVHQQWEKKIDLEREAQTLYRRLKTEAGSNSFDWLDRSLAAIDKIQLEAEIENLRSDLEERENEKQQLTDEIGGIRKEIEQLEEKRDTVELLQRSEQNRTEIVAQAHSWAVYKTAELLLNSARSQYEKERQPEVIKSAAEYFRTITGNAYSAIVSPPDGEPLYIVDRNGAQKTAGTALSKGTAEELYFAIRLGLIADFSSRQEPLPVLLDDIFVNMDDNRTPKAVEAVSHLLSTNQVFIFTCHTNTADLVIKQFPECKIMKLENGKTAS